MDDEHIPAGTIVVGLDGSSGSEGAVDWAAQQARLEHRPLTLVHAVPSVFAAGSAWLDTTGIDQAQLALDLRTAGAALLASVEERIRRTAPDIEIHRVLRPVDAREALLDLAPGAAMIVVGSRGRGPLASLLLGSVSVAVSKHAPCPVVVIRPQDPSIARRGILVGVDATGQSQAAIEFAYRTASLRSLPLTVLHCFWDAVALAAGAPRDVADDDTTVEDQRLLLAESVSGMGELFPDVSVRLQLTRGFADQRLVRDSPDLDLIVVGSHRVSLLNELVYGTVAPTVVEHASCAVAVVPSPPS